MFLKDGVFLSDRRRKNFLSAFLAAAIFCVLAFPRLSADPKVDLKRPPNKLAPTRKSESKRALEERKDFQKPGEPNYGKFTPFQDSVYYSAMKIRIPSSTRFELDFKNYLRLRELSSARKRPSLWRIAQDNLAIKKEYLIPDPREIVQRQIAIDRALSVPNMPTRKVGGVSVNLRDIGKFLGLVEDVSPVISFETSYPEEIEILIYSVQAKAVAVVFKGVRPPGKQRFVWNLRDNEGKPLPSGDYVAEVRIGKTRYFRKRIVVP